VDYFQQPIRRGKGKEMGTPKDIREAVALNGTVPSYPQYLESAAGNITLTGLVKYGSQREPAERAVAGLTGVRNIHDEIEIGYGADPVDVTWLVQDALDRHGLIADDSDVSVDTSGNTVTLRGYVRTWAGRDAVAGAAWMAGGVSEVRDDLVITG
jgi:osmotically-inducible protein OsmY